ncbi:hypothetical protein VTJ83DRAFT_6851 [Remersonia thermophila]|uniref:Alpha/beta hydrolase fold-3 domain-containing protein n=1 Tax=Remersonia thermophila TaxID=72144 RepID=A0ABR4D5X0_9PEZI
MIDHLLGRPSVKSRRLQVLTVLTLWILYLVKGHKHGPSTLRVLSRWLSKRLTAWQTFAFTLIYLYAARNFSTLVGLASPDPLTNMYDPHYFRATWVLTALDAGFWTAMNIRNRALRDVASIVFSVFYLFAAEKADEKVRKVRGNITVEHMRVSWNKGNQSPILRFAQGLLRPRYTRWPPRQLRIHRPAASDYKEPVMAWLYFDGPLTELRRHTEIVLDIPGGGFVAMDPRCNDDKLFAWAAKTGRPVISLDYRKAPEYPYPYALNECYDAYTTIIRTRGRCIGLSGDVVPKVVITGDSAGGNLATATTLMIIESGSSPVRRFSATEAPLPVPDGLVLFYPALDMNIGSWMSDEQMMLIKDRRMGGTNRPIMQRKQSQYLNLAGGSVKADDDDDPPPSRPVSDASGAAPLGTPPGTPPEVDAAKPAPEYATSGATTWSTVLQGPPAPASPTATKKSVAGSGAAAAASPSAAQPGASHHPQQMRTRLAMSSMISYFNDRVLTPEMMRGMVILYIGPHNRPDFSRDYLLSPVLAPEVLLSKFPKTYFLTGERDPLVDDTIIFAGRLQRVKAAQMASGGQRLNYKDEDALTKGFNQKDVAEVTLLPGVSHGFMQFPTVYPPAFKHIARSAEWINKLLDDARARDRKKRMDEEGGLLMPGWKTRRARGVGAGAREVEEKLKSSVGELAAEQENEAKGRGRHHRRCESSGSEDQPLEMIRMTRKKKAANGEKGTGELADAATPATHPQTNGSMRTNGNGEGKAKREEEDESSDATITGVSTGSTSPCSEPKHQTKSTAGKDEEENANGASKRSSSSSSPASTARRRSTKSRKSRGKNNMKDAGLVKLASTEDLLSRRMHGLASGLTRVGGDPE